MRLCMKLVNGNRICFFLSRSDEPFQRYGFLNVVLQQWIFFCQKTNFTTLHSVYTLTEKGYIIELYKQLHLFINSKFRSQFRTFYGLEEYLQKYLKIRTLSLENFELLFQMLFVVEIAVAVLFGLAYLFSFRYKICPPWFQDLPIRQYLI